MGKGRRLGRPGKARALHPDPNRTISAHLDACPHCQAAFPHQAQSPQQRKATVAALVRTTQ